MQNPPQNSQGGYVVRIKPRNTMIHAISRLLRQWRKLVLVLSLVLFVHYSSFFWSKVFDTIYIGITNHGLSPSKWRACIDYLQRHRVSTSPGGKNVVLESSRCCDGDCLVTLELESTDFISTRHPVFVFHLRRGCFKTEPSAFMWLSESELEIEDVHVGRIELQKQEVKGVKIKYNVNAFDLSPPESLAIVGIVSYPDKYSDIDFDKTKSKIKDLAASGKISHDQQHAMLNDLYRFQDTLCWRLRATLDQTK